MSDKMREALEMAKNSLRTAIMETGDNPEADAHIEVAMQRIDESLAAPPTEQTGRVISEELFKEIEREFVACGWIELTKKLHDAPRTPTHALSLPSVDTLNSLQNKLSSLEGAMGDDDPYMWNYIHEAQALVDALLAARLGKPVEVDRWIPVTERLPEPGRYIVQWVNRASGETRIDVADYADIPHYNGGPSAMRWFLSRLEITRAVTHWQRCPQSAGVVVK